MKILILASHDRSLVAFRGALIGELVRRGHAVVAAAPPVNPEVPAELAALGAGFIPIGFDRTGLNPMADLRAYRRIRMMLARERPDVLLSYTLKPVLYGSLAGGAVGVGRIYAIITGLGSIFFTRGIRATTLRFGARGLYHLALQKCRKVFVQNPDILEYLTSRGMARREKLVLVRGSGLDLTHFAPSPVPEGSAVFLYLGRLLKDKGLRELAEAAEILKAAKPDAIVRIVGDTDSNPTSLSAETVAEWKRQGIIDHQPACEDVRPWLRSCRAYVLPSYHEGLPRSVLEAMATGRAIITSDVMGCRETVALPKSGEAGADRLGLRQGENGFLVPAKSSAALAAAMIRLAEDRHLSVAMGKRSREIVTAEFDVRDVNRRLMEEMELASAVDISPPSGTRSAKLA